MGAYRINYVELPVPDTKAARAFYESAFGWSLRDFAPTYSATTGGDVTRPIFGFPGGRRFHFRDPGGNELAVWQPT